MLPVPRAKMKLLLLLPVPWLIACCTYSRFVPLSHWLASLSMLWCNKKKMKSKVIPPAVAHTSLSWVSFMDHSSGWCHCESQLLLLLLVPRSLGPAVIQLPKALLSHLSTLSTIYTCKLGCCWCCCPWSLATFLDHRSKVKTRGRGRGSICIENSFTI